MVVHVDKIFYYHLNIWGGYIGTDILPSNTPHYETSDSWCNKYLTCRERTTPSTRVIICFAQFINDVVANWYIRHTQTYAKLCYNIPVTYRRTSTFTLPIPETVKKRCETQKGNLVIINVCIVTLHKTQFLLFIHIYLSTIKLNVAVSYWQIFISRCQPSLLLTRLVFFRSR